MDGCEGAREARYGRVRSTESQVLLGLHRGTDPHPLTETHVIGRRGDYCWMLE